VVSAQRLRTRTGIGALRNDELRGVPALSCKSNFGTGASYRKPGIKNEITGKVHEAKGKIREKAGPMTNNPDLEGEGLGEKIAG
jgi:hypothetical protein